MLRGFVARLRQSLPQAAATTTKEETSKVPFDAKQTPPSNSLPSTSSPPPLSTAVSPATPSNTFLRDLSSKTWTSVRSMVPPTHLSSLTLLQVPDPSNVARSTSTFVSQQASKLDAGARQGAQFVHERTVGAAKQGAQYVQRKAVDTTVHGAKLLQDATTHVGASARTGAQYVHKQTTKKVVDAGAALVDSSKKTLDRTRQSVVASSSAAVTMAAEAMDPRAKVRRMRNQVLLLVFAGIFVYGFASALPHALAKYAAEMQKERAKRQQQATSDTS
ncbi:Aste57867_22487 [Aphanomyces stellatus]|uniref:Aste57867_22487 protein n=1 Tax=Aphanomyces stellatus TaxID=120398 RepID=A0A485LKX1_9STRA|nr:hypothetical protein As57867_022417 [Aphanomyces stellatus]VFT99147.1 Aste57867_22487 [Aphanomyces stellatus]